MSAVGLSTPAGRPLATAVLRITPEALSLTAVDRELRVRAQRSAPNPPQLDAPYPALDVHHIWRWLTAALGALGESFRIEAVVPTAFGQTAALVEGERLVLPMMRPEAEPPAALREAFAAVAPSENAVGMRTPASGTSLGLQLFWQQKAFPSAFERARWILPHAASWGFRLTGVAASEASSLADAGQVLEIRSVRPSTLVRRQGWHTRMPSLREPHRLLGRLVHEMAERTGLSPATPVLVGGTDTAVAHGRLLAAGFDRAALLLVEEATLLVPGDAAPDADRRTLLTLDRRPLVRVSLPTGVTAASVNYALTTLEHRGPVVIAGEWPEANDFAAGREPGMPEVFTLDATTLVAEGAALLVHWGQRPPPRLAMQRLGTDD